MNTQTDSGKAPALARFVALPENRAALLAVRRLAGCLARPGGLPPFPVLFLHGPSGTGKTHLAAALVELVTAQTPARTAQTVAARDLGRIARESVANLADNSWRELRECDVLVAEDLQHFPAEAAESLVNLLDFRRKRGRCTAVTAREGPALLPGLPRRLSSRLAAGLVVGLEPLGPRSRGKLVETFLRQRSLRVAEDVVPWLAARMNGGGVRPLLGALAQLETLSKVHPPPLGLATITGEIGEPPDDDVSPLERIAGRVGSHFRVKLGELRGPGRHRDLLWPRQLAMYLARQLTGLSLGQVGAYFGGRDHATVLHACRKVEKALAADPALVGLLRQLEAELG